jgi:hypothetical protein
MADAGYGAADCERVQVLLRKEGIKRDTEVQTLEDVACLVFLEHYLMPFAAGQDDEKLAGILAKTWVKMSSAGQDAVGALNPPQRILALLAKGLARESGDETA